MPRHLSTRIELFGILPALAGCVVWPAQSGMHAISPGLSFQGEQPACRSTLRGVLWPPADQPTFVVGGRRIVASSAGIVLAERETDRRGRFELALKDHGPYTVSFTTTYASTSASTSASAASASASGAASAAASAASAASASAEITISPCATKRIDLVAHLIRRSFVPPSPAQPASATR